MRLQDVQPLAPTQMGSSVNVPPQRPCGAAGSAHGWGIFRWPQMGEFGWPPGAWDRLQAQEWFSKELRPVGHLPGDRGGQFRMIRLLRRDAAPVPAGGRDTP